MLQTGTILSDIVSENEQSTEYVINNYTVKNGGTISVLRNVYDMGKG